MFGLFSGSCPVNAATPYASTLVETKPDGFPTAVLGGGCFWCVEHTMRKIEGVKFTRVGYEGGGMDNPNYDQVSTGRTGHAEVVEVTFDPAQISYHDLLVKFMTDAHDPTQLNKQGVDEGTQYRSVIYTLDDEQAKTAKDVVAELQPRFKNKIVTDIEPSTEFWTGEDYHQRYYEKYEARTGEQHIRVKLKEQKKAQQR
jgi:peptide-methionine (S)-S-oxide reductase